MRSDVVWWTDEKIAFYERASRYTSFHRDLASLIEEHIGKDDTIMELGAGLGHVTSILYNDGYTISAYDSCKNAVDYANRREGRELIALSDAYSLKERADVVLMLFFGSIREKSDLDYFISLARKKIIYVISRHKGNPYSTRKDRREEISSLLSGCGMKFSIIDTMLQFDQMLKEEEVEEYFNISYGNNDIPKLEKTNDWQYPLVFKNRKEISIFIIEKEEKK